ncbi:MAG: NAD(P)H-hydrate dehydratase [Bacteroidales bacterium]|nr:NAD(P)H-hydrate dehydratase [Bacteroidales bacterium]
MKILPIDKIREADEYTIKNEPISDIDLMERAALELYEWMTDNIDSKKQIRIFCGLGNNGGDGYALGRMLAGAGFKVHIFTVWFTDKMSPGCETNYERAKSTRGLVMVDLHENDELPEIGEQEVVIDALFGSGLSRPVKKFPGRVVDHINDSNALVVAIDAPSGLFADKSNTDNDGSIIRADYTLTFQFPKQGFLFPENDPFVGQWEVLPIGLHPDFINRLEVSNFFLTGNMLAPVLKNRTKYSHKGTYGHGLLIAGGYGKMGAAVLAARAGLRSGAGLITAHIPTTGNRVMQTANPEVMVSHDEDDYKFTHHPDLSKFNAIAIGPGLGTDEQTANGIKVLIQDTGLPIIFDADAINILGENKTWISFIPKESIFTPHPKEFERLVGKSSNNFDRFEMQREFSIKHQVYVILKGAHTAISCPDGKVYFNSTGNPGMATGGSGDVLTGILLGLKAGGYTSKETCLLGVYLHGLAGDFAAQKKGFESLIAGDITSNLNKAFKRLRKLR